MAQLTLEHIETEMQNEGISPHTAVSFRTYLAALYSLRAGEMQKIQASKPGTWLNMRAKNNSDKATDLAWQQVAAGMRETELKWELKRIEKLSSALASMLRVMEGEAKHQY